MAIQSKKIWFGIKQIFHLKTELCNFFNTAILEITVPLTLSKEAIYCDNIFMKRVM